MRTCETCNCCTVVEKDKNGKPVFTAKPDSNCEIRNNCPDDGSSTEQREQELSKWPKIQEEPTLEKDTGSPL